MNNPVLIQYFKIKDSIREGLIKYLSEALSIIPEIKNPQILDIGCGTGVPTLELARRYIGTIYAVDINSDSLRFFRQKLHNENLSDRVKLIHNSFFSEDFGCLKFDIILAEGLLNIVGFDKGFSKLIKLAKKKGYIIIHDDSQNRTKKNKIIKKNSCEVIKSFILSEEVWRNNYYEPLESKINSLEDNKLLSLFQSDLHEIELFKSNPSQLSSTYYIIRKL